jgi:hypothetical protein
MVNMIMISHQSGTEGKHAIVEPSVVNPAWVRLDAAGEYRLKGKSTSGSAETFVVYEAGGSIVGQKAIAQEAP